MKKTITIAVIVLVCVGFGYWLFKISPEQQAATTGGYNALLTDANAKQLANPPAFDPTTDHYQGDPKAKNVFIEYGDLQCPACAAANPMLNQVATQFPDTVFVFRYFPLIQIHQNSVEAALAAEAANAQGKFWQFHDLVFQKQSEWESLSDPLDKFAEYAQTVGVANIDQFKSDVTSKKYLSLIQNDYNQALGLSLQGTPTLYINNQQIQNAADINGLKQEAQQYFSK